MYDGLSLMRSNEMKVLSSLPLASDHQEYEAIEHFFANQHVVEFMLEGKRLKKRFSPPSFHIGGQIPLGHLLKEENIELLKIDLIPSVDIIYRALEGTRTLVKTRYHKEHGWIPLITKVLHACERRNIPQNFAPGIMLMYLELCEGCEWRHLVRRIYEDKKMALIVKEKMVLEGKEEAKDIDDSWTEYQLDQVYDLIKAMTKKRNLNAKK